MEVPRTQNSKKILLKNKTRKQTLPDFKFYYKAILDQDGVILPQRQMDQWNRIKRPEIDPYLYEQAVFNKSTKAVQCKRDNLFTKRCWNNYISISKKANFYLYFVPYTKYNSKWTIDLYVKHKTVKHLEEKLLTVGQAKISQIQQQKHDL